LRNVKVNAVIKEAGIGKGLLYNYFGGLPGLVRAWGEKERIWPNMQELAKGAHGTTSQGEPDIARMLQTLVHNHAQSLKDVPFRVELLADELMNPTGISDALSEVREQLGREHQALYDELPELKSDDVYSLFRVFMAAASFLAMRSVTNPRYRGTNIGSRQGWSHLMKDFDRVVELAVKGLEAERGATKTSRKTCRQKRARRTES
jgi:AcrR family transcriptional regulator